MSDRWNDGKRQDLPQRLRTRLVDLMVKASSPEQRQAAARALVTWPTENYRLRVAEWGVLIASGSGYTLPQTIIDEIPPFVHQTANKYAELYNRVPVWMSAKPIIHITSDTPLAIDLEVQIRGGRPWFAYPLPDDFAMSMVNGNSQMNFSRIGNAFAGEPLEKFDNPSLSPLPNPSEGYPWISPNHRQHVQGAIKAVGLRWQSLVVMPQQQAWMREPAVPNDPKFSWWKRLRDVPSSWVWNQGEAERFIFYDGPTNSPAPIMVTRQDRTLTFSVGMFTADGGLADRAIGSDGRSDWLISMPQTGPRVDRQGLFIEIRGSDLHLAVVTVPPTNGPVELVMRAASEDEAADQLRTLLCERGLSTAEADGLIEAWRPHFFRTAGARFIMLMNAHDYDTLNPISIRPAPTELVRVGIVLTEFGNG